MASTNKTTNYDLSQFLGTDKPAWLTDYNSDMNKIDTGIKNAADSATAAGGAAAANTTAIGTLSSLTTENKTDLVSAINEVDANADTAQGTASAAATLAGSAKDEADALNSYLSITQTGKISPTVSGGTIGNINDAYYALNAGGTLGKVYGRVRITGNTTGTITLTLPVSALNVSEAFTIAGGAYFTVWNSGASSPSIINGIDMTVNTNGNITIEFSNIAVNATITVWLPPCLYFFKDFGDQYNPNV